MKRKHSFIGLEHLSASYAYKLPLNYRKLEYRSIDAKEEPVLDTYNKLIDGVTPLTGSSRLVSKMVDLRRLRVSNNVTEEANENVYDQLIYARLDENLSKPFYLYTCCFVTEGAERSLLIDTQREEFYFIPNVLAGILKAQQDLAEKKKPLCSFNDLVKQYGEENAVYLKQYFEFLLENQLIFFLEFGWEAVAFPKVDTTKYISAPLIEHVIADIDSHSTYSIEDDLFPQLLEIGCQYLEIRFFQKVVFQKDLQFLSRLANTLVKSVELVLPYNKWGAASNIKISREDYPWLSKLSFYNAPFDKLYLAKQSSDITLLYTTENLVSASHCGKINKWTFSGNLPMITLNSNHNSCLHKSLGIDVQGRIKNCPSMANSFGDIRADSLKVIASKDSFQSKWAITKDQIDTCKICEFRQICSDCRAFTKNNELKGKPAKCGYDPYTMKWED